MWSASPASVTLDGNRRGGSSRAPPAAVGVGSQDKTIWHRNHMLAVLPPNLRGETRRLPTRRILMVYTLTGRGGDSVQVLALAEAMRRLGHKVELVGGLPIRPYAFGDLDGRARSFARGLPWWARDGFVLGLNLAVFLKALLAAVRFRPDTVFERVTPYGPAGRWLARLLRCPLVAHLDAPYAEENAYRGDGTILWLHRRAMRRLGVAADVVALGSESSRRHFAKLGIPPSRTVLMRNGVFPDEMVAAPVGTEQPQVLGFVGSMQLFHGVDLLIDAATRLRRSGHPVRVRIVGRGWDTERLVALIEARGLADVVELVGPVSHPEALRLIDTFGIAVLPDTLPSGAPMKLIEYAARGIPAVAPDLPTLRQMWGDDALAYFTPGDAEALASSLGFLLDHPEERTRLAVAAWQIVGEQYTWETQVGGVLAALDARARGARRTQPWPRQP